MALIIGWSIIVGLSLTEWGVKVFLKNDVLLLGLGQQNKCYVSKYNILHDGRKMCEQMYMLKIPSQ